MEISQGEKSERGAVSTRRWFRSIYRYEDEERIRRKKNGREGRAIRTSERMSERYSTPPKAQI